jgi:DNA-binding NarL/FixJ family response regulator
VNGASGAECLLAGAVFILRFGGPSNRKVGEKIELSEGSVKNVVLRLFSKAGVRTRSELVRLALEGNLNLGRVAARA